MKGDNKRRKLIKEINSLTTEWLAHPNQCAYTDSIITEIAIKTEELKKSYN